MAMAPSDAVSFAIHIAVPEEWLNQKRDLVL
jgi:hypothetical protein